MKRIFALILSSSLLLPLFASHSITALQSCNERPFSQNSSQLLYARPILRVAIVPATNELIIRDIYEIMNNGETMFADWVAYKLDGSTFGEARDAAFATDGCLSPDRTLEATPAADDDYAFSRGAGYVPTPLAPNATFAGSPQWADTQLYSNVVPMHEDLVGAWHQLESDVRDFVSEGNEVYVLTGPVYRNEMPRLPRADEDHQVPSGYWKIVYQYQEPTDPNNVDSLNYYAVFLDQTGCLSSDENDQVSCRSINNDYTKNPIRIVDLEGFTRLDFFTGLENVEEFRVERQFGTLDLTGSE